MPIAESGRLRQTDLGGLGIQKPALSRPDVGTGEVRPGRLFIDVAELIWEPPVKDVAPSDEVEPTAHRSMSAGTGNILWSGDLGRWRPTCRSDFDDHAARELGFRPALSS